MPSGRQGRVFHFSSGLAWAVVSVVPQPRVGRGCLAPAAAAAAAAAAAVLPRAAVVAGLLAEGGAGRGAGTSLRGATRVQRLQDLPVAVVWRRALRAAAAASRAGRTRAEQQLQLRGLVEVAGRRQPFGLGGPVQLPTESKH